MVACNLQTTVAPLPSGAFRYVAAQRLLLCRLSEVPGVAGAMFTRLGMCGVEIRSDVSGRVVRFRLVEVKTAGARVLAWHFVPLVRVGVRRLVIVNDSGGNIFPES